VVDVEIVNRSGVAFDGDAATLVVRDVLSAEGIDDGEVGLTLVEPAEIQALKRDHLGIDEPTDALAFPIDGRDELPPGLPRQLGDIVLCPDVVGDGWRSPLVHAVLHLLGYDHGASMEAREQVHAQ
jgi:probable rRNA maturation factor